MSERTVLNAALRRLRGLVEVTRGRAPVTDPRTQALLARGISSIRRASRPQGTLADRLLEAGRAEQALTEVIEITEVQPPLE